VILTVLMLSNLLLMFSLALVFISSICRSSDEKLTTRLDTADGNYPDVSDRLEYKNFSICRSADDHRGRRLRTPLHHADVV